MGGRGMLKPPELQVEYATEVQRKSFTSNVIAMVPKCEWFWINQMFC